MKGIISGGITKTRFILTMIFFAGHSFSQLLPGAAQKNIEQIYHLHQRRSIHSIQYMWFERGNEKNYFTKVFICKTERNWKTREYLFRYGL